MNLPNALTFSRFLLSGALMAGLFMTFPFARTAALLAFAAAAATDALDGHLARRRYGVTPLGTLMDPLADKVLVTAAFVSFVELRLVPAWIVVLILAREFLVTGLRVLAGQQGRSIAAGTWGKHKTAWQLVVIALLLAGLVFRDDVLPRWPVVAPEVAAPYFQAAAYVLAAGAAAITVVSGAVYFRRHADLIAPHL